MKIKFEGFKLEIKKFELDDSDKESVEKGYKKALHQIAVIISKEQDLEKVKDEIQSLMKFPNLS